MSRVPARRDLFRLTRRSGRGGGGRAGRARGSSRVREPARRRRRTLDDVEVSRAVSRSGHAPAARRRISRRFRAAIGRRDDDAGWIVRDARRTFLAAFLDWPSAPPSAAGSSATEVAGFRARAPRQPRRVRTSSLPCCLSCPSVAGSMGMGDAAEPHSPSDPSQFLETRRGRNKVVNANRKSRQTKITPSVSRENLASRCLLNLLAAAARAPKHPRAAPHHPQAHRPVRDPPVPVNLGHHAHHRASPAPRPPPPPPPPAPPTFTSLARATSSPSTAMYPP